jgi:hypothetical protein
MPARVGRRPFQRRAKPGVSRLRQRRLKAIGPQLLSQGMGGEQPGERRVIGGIQPTRLNVNGADCTGTVLTLKRR